MDFFYMFLVVAIIFALIFFTLFMPIEHHKESLIEGSKENKIIITNTQEQVRRVKTRTQNIMKSERVKS